MARRRSTRSSDQIDFKYASPDEHLHPSDLDSLIIFPDRLPKYPLPRINDEPLSSPAVSPIKRAIYLSKLHALLDPTARPEPRQIHEAFSALHHLSPSHILTPDEIEAVLRKLLRAIKREGTNHYDAQSMLQSTRRALGSFAKGPVSPTYDKIVARIKSVRRPTSTTLGTAEKQVTAFPKDDSSVQHRDSVHLLLRLCAALPDPERFERWWIRAERLGLDTHFHSTRLSLFDSLGKVNEIDEPFLLGIKSAIDGKKERSEAIVRYTNHALGIAARGGSWNFAFGVYEALTGCHISSDLIRTSAGFLGDNHLVDVPVATQIRDLKLQPDRITFSTLLGALAKGGYVSEAIQVLHDMDRANHAPFVGDYSVLIRGFQYHSEIVPPTSAESQATYALFPKWEMRQKGSITRPKGAKKSSSAWDGEPHSSDWTRSALNQVFAGLLALKPGMRRVENWTNEKYRVDSYRAPAPQTILNLLSAYARVSGCDLALLNKIWETVDTKFSAGEWTDWKSVHGQGDAAAGQGHEPSNAEDTLRERPVLEEGERRGDWVYWKTNRRLTTLVAGLQALKRGQQPPEPLPRRRG